MKSIRFLAAALALVVCHPVLAGGKKGEAVDIAFHIETDPGENPRMIFNHEDKIFRRVPEVSTKDVESYNPFPSRDGEGYGVLLRLKPGARNRLAAVTSANQGRWLIARVNGRIVDASMIDGQVSDGELVIWKGIALPEIQEFDKKFPRKGEQKPRG